jgi:hypothetical protein
MKKACMSKENCLLMMCQKPNPHALLKAGAIDGLVLATAQLNLATTKTLIFGS